MVWYLAANTHSRHKKNLGNNPRYNDFFRGRGSMAEYNLPKVETAVRFRSPAPLKVVSYQLLVVSCSER